VASPSLRERLGFEHPVWNAPMGGGTAGPELAAAVSNAGGFGLLGIFALPPSRIGTAVARTRTLTRRAFGAGVVLHGAHAPAQIEACLDERLPLLLFFWGDLSPWVKDAHARGMLVAAQVGSVEEAARAAEAGADVIVAQGVEAGGHVRGRTQLAALVPAVARAVAPLPVVAAGGIGDGRALATALARGAEAALLGTRFLASAEAVADERYKRALVAATASQTMLTTLFDVGWPDAPHRVIRNRVVERWEDAGRPESGRRPGEGDVIGRAAIAGREIDVVRYSISHPMPGFTGDLEDACLYAGESCSAIESVLPAEEIVAELVRGALEPPR
jgi:nitronate monooxygenase